MKKVVFLFVYMFILVMVIASCASPPVPVEPEFEVIPSIELPVPDAYDALGQEAVEVSVQEMPEPQAEELPELPDEVIPEPEDMSDDLVVDTSAWFLIEDAPDWFGVYASLISAYLDFENGGQPAEIIRDSTFVQRHYFFLEPEFGGILVFALHDINGSGIPELIIGFTRIDEIWEGLRVRVCNVYSLDSGSVSRIINSEITDEIHIINTRSISHYAGNLIENITEFTLSLDGKLVEEYLISIALGDCNCCGHYDGEILDESGISLNDTPTELNWRRLYEFGAVVYDFQGEE